MVRKASLIDTIIASMPGVVYLFDEPGKLMCWNQNLERISGYSAEEVAQMHPLDFFGGADRRLVAEKLREVLENGESSIEAIPIRSPPASMLGCSTKC